MGGISSTGEQESTALIKASLVIQQVGVRQAEMLMPL
ncbi:hypothetical protein ABID22_004135 [Pontibacter aydingkolensis]